MFRGGDNFYHAAIKSAKAATAELAIEAPDNFYHAAIKSGARKKVAHARRDLTPLTNFALVAI
jgi:hypothetical protein